MRGDRARSPRAPGSQVPVTGLHPKPHLRAARAG